jgi:hypothetical protein
MIAAKACSHETSGLLPPTQATNARLSLCSMSFIATDLRTTQIGETTSA